MTRNTSSSHRLAPTRLAVIFSVVWAVVCIFFFFLMPMQTVWTPGLIIMVGVAALLPIAMVWLATGVAQNFQNIRSETAQLRQDMTLLRDSVQSETRSSVAALEYSLNRRLKAMERSPTGPDVASTPQQGGTRTQDKVNSHSPDPVGQSGLSTPDLIRALNFPDTEHDKAGFAALRRALKDAQARQVVQSSQDLLTLLSQSGIYMDDLPPDIASPDLWRRYASGSRGASVAAVGGVRDEYTLERVAQRMRDDAIFRDAAHYFLRKFDRMLTAFVEVADDDEMIAMANTRTARAFMLVGRVTGVFS